MENFVLDRGELESYPEPRCEWHDKITFEMAERIAKLLPANGKILDVGCGQGPALEWFTEKGFKCFGVTTNREDYIFCFEKGYSVFMIDQNEIPVEWQLFDGVWARHVLEHSIAPFYTLNEFFRILKPEGILYIEVPAPQTAADHEGNVNHYSVMGWQMWASLIDRAGFQVLEAKEIPFEIPNIGPDCYFSFIAKKK